VGSAGGSPARRAWAGPAGVAAARRQFARFLLSGGLVALVYLALMALFVTVAGLPSQAALALAYALALALHFSLNRQFVFGSRRHSLHLARQGVRYLVLVAFGYGVTAVALALLPGPLGLPDLAVYFIVAGCLVPVNFFVMRAWVFHAPFAVKTE
jgi:putative flippase GtrA